MAVKMTKKEQRELEELQKAQKVKKTPALTEQEKLALKAEAQTNLAERRAETARNKAAAQSNANKPTVVKNTAADRELKQQAAVQAAEKVERLSPADVARKNAELKAAKEVAQGNLQNRKSDALLRKGNFIGPVKIDPKAVKELPVIEKKEKPSTLKAIGDAAFGGITSFNKSLAQGLKAFDDWTAEHLFYGQNNALIDAITRPYLEIDEKQQEKIQQNIESGAINQFASDLVSSTVNTLPSMAVGALSGGLSTAGAVGAAGQSTVKMIGDSLLNMAKNPQSLLSFAQIFGGSYESAKNDGATTDEAIAAALLNALPATVIEMAGGNEKLVKELVKEKGFGSLVQTAKRLLQSAGEEALEEVAQYPFDALSKKATYDEETPWFSVTENAVINPKEMSETALMAFLSSLILGGGAAAVEGGINGISKIRVGNKEVDVETVLDAIEEGLNEPEGSEVHEAAAAAAELLGAEEVTSKTPPAVINRVQEAIDATRKAFEQGETPEIRQSNRSKEYQGRQERRFRNRIKGIFSVPNTIALRQEFDDMIADAAEEVKQNGKISRNTADKLFNEAYNSGIVVLDEYYNQYKALKDQIRSTKLSISAEDAANIPDFNLFRRQNFGTLSFGADGLPVDIAYQQLREQAPELFPRDITHPADQLKKISEVAKGIKKAESTLDDYYGDEKADFLEFAREDFENALGDFVEEINRVQEVDRQDALSFQRKLALNPEGLTAKEAEELGHELNRESRKVELAEKNNLLTANEKAVVQDFLKNGRSDFENISPAMNRKGIQNVVEASRRKHEISQILSGRRKKILDEKRQAASGLLTNSDLWQDKNSGFEYSRETAERNLRDIMKADSEGYQKIKAAIFDPIHKNEAAKQKFMNVYRERVKALNLDADESRWVQLLGENAADEVQAPENVDLGKVKKAVEEFRKIYSELYDQVNETLVRNGYEPIEAIEGYFPHFQEEVTWLHPIRRLQQINEDSKLPADMAGLTHTFRPGKRWSGHLQHREGVRTDYNAVKGLDQYLDSVADVIYHTDDIQNLRAFETAIRQKYSKEGTDTKVSLATEGLSVPEAEKVADSLYGELLDNGNGGLGNFVTWIRRYTDILAGKKALIDREIEHETGRAVYKLVSDWESRISKNMVSTNLSSALSNFIPIVQATGEVKDKYLLRAMRDTVKNTMKSDGFEENSTFITNRKGSDKAFKTTGDKVADVLSIPFEAVDSFTTNVVTRGKYLQLLDEGVDPETAMERADEFAASLMADRSLGAQPTAFATKNPIFKLFTMFQTEANNQFSYLFKDLPENVKEEGKNAYAKSLMRIAIYTFLAGLGYEELTGRDPQFNPLGMIFDFVMDATDEEKGLAEAALNFGKTAVEQTPFVGGLAGGGRFPVSSGLIPFEDVYNSIVNTIKGEQSLKKWGSDMLNDVLKPASMTFLPIGANQLYKTISGVKTVAEGGLYGVQSDGGKKLKYAVNQTPGNFIKGALFGKSAFPEASAYYDSFKPVTDLDASGTRLGKLKSRIPEDTLDLFELKAKDTTGGRDVQREAEKAALASVIKYTQRDKNGEAILDENGDPVKNTVQLSPDEKREYQRRYEALLPKDMTGLSDEVRNKIFNFAEDAAALEVLGSDYDPGSGVKKALQAMEAGVDIATYFELQHEMAQFEPQKLRDGKEITTTQQKRSLLLNDDRLNSQQKSKLDKLLIQTSDDKKEINYENANTVAASLLSESQQKRYSGVTAAFGGSVTVAQYEGYAKTINDAKADKDQWGDSIAGTAKANAIAALQRQGLSLAKAHEVYALVKGGVPTDTSNKTAALLSTMDDNEQARYKAAKSYFSSMTPTDYLVYSDAISSANAGSYSEKIKALKNYGFTEMQAAVFIGCNEVSKKTDLSDPNRIIYQTFTDSQKEKFERVTASPTFAKMREYDFYYFYKMMGSGKKAEKLSALRNAGLSAAQAEAFYKLVS